jgi:ATP-dependent 26S proteasome regulatory subunit
LQTHQFELTPAQQRAFEGISNGLALGEVFVLKGAEGMGKSTILRKLASQRPSCLLGAREFMDALSAGAPAALEEAFLRVIDEAIDGHELIIFDDLSLITDVTGACDYTRSHLLDVALTAAADKALRLRRKLLFAVNDDAPNTIGQRALSWEIEEFAQEDYQTLCCAYLSSQAADRLDFEEIHRFGPKLNGHQLRNTSVWLHSRTDLDTAAFIEHLRERHMASNVEIEEVETVQWTDLKGAEDLIHALEAKVALPFENRELAARLGLKPKRGVLLAGPPGTGKTTIGRALAHRLKSKFFLIDGTVVAGSSRFYTRVDRIFDNAQRNAPSIIFIDDSDVIFENDEEKGFYRYLLTKLDGLESASNGRVCVMMTAMDASSLPAALLRSGRVELWLETRLPHEEARIAILSERLEGLPQPFCEVDIAPIAQASRGLTGADLKALVEDAKLQWAHDLTRDETRPIQEYFLEAVETLRNNKRNYRRRRPQPMLESGIFGYPTDE